jgi:PAS domain S-box-containing protein
MSTNQVVHFEDYYKSLDKWFEVSVYPSENGLSVYFKDVTERKKMQSQLIEHGEQLELFIEHSPVSIAMFDNEMRYIAVSHRWVSDYQLEGTPVIGKTHYEIFPEIDQHWKEIHQRCLHGSIEKCEEESFTRVDGSKNWLRWEIHPWHRASGEIGGIILFTEIITERKTAQEKIENLNVELEEKVIRRTEQLKKTNEELEAFSYSVSHDLRAPLRAIVGFTAILEEDYGNKLDAEAKRITGVIKSNTIKMGNLIDDLLTFSRMGRQDIIKTSVDNNRLVKEIIDNTGNSYKNIEWVVSSLPCVNADLNTLRQVWINLISNAEKYTVKAIQPKIEIGSFHKDKQTVFFVKDNGVGFDEKYKDKLFRVFQRLHSADEFEGTGIGLAIVDKIISKYGGKVWAEAALNKGASFYFSLPADEN